ncbi:OTU-domain-containing protein [Hypomontagnella monticulosa]|nr:OTU-domain-containing protein [Hypomontagnella monticulosa]
MQIRFKGPKGAGMVEIDDSATVNDLFAALKSDTGGDVTVKYGYPPKPLGVDQGLDSLQSLGLHRERLTVEPKESAAAAVAEQPLPVHEPVATTPSPVAPTGQFQNVKDQNISVTMPETGSTLVLRVMPDDNSCLFTAVGGALRGLRSGADEYYSADSLRRIVVDHIQANPERYTKVVLDNKPPQVYCRNMLQPDTWGGAIELDIISEVFEIEISSVDVKTGRVYTHGEGNGYEMRCVLVYSNIHYDRVAEVFVEGQEAMEFDVTRWSADACEHVIAHTKEMCKKLRDEYHYYTDTSDFIVRCTAPGCDWIGQGQEAVALHASKTGHTDIVEIADPNA